MKLSYWVAKCLDDADAYSIRAKTRQAVEIRLRQGEATRFGSPKRVTTPEFTGSFDMLEQCLGEGGAWWENEVCDAPQLAVKSA